jgi:hypothetical protein
VQLLDARHLAAAGRVQLLLPAAYLALVEALRPAEVGQADRGRVERVQVGECVHQTQHQRMHGRWTERLQLGDIAVDRAVDILHQVEGSADDVRVGAEQHRLGSGEASLGQRVEDLVLAGHIVRGRQHVAERRPAQHPTVRAVGDRVREVGPPARQDRRLQIGAGAEVGTEADQVQAGRSAHDSAAASNVRCILFMPLSQRSGSVARRW